MIEKIEIQEHELTGVETLTGQAARAWLDSFAQLERRRIGTLVRLVPAILAFVAVSIFVMNQDSDNALLFGIGLIFAGILTMAYFSLTLGAFDCHRVDDSGQHHFHLCYAYRPAYFAVEMLSLLKIIVSSPKAFFVTLVIVVVYPLGIAFALGILIQIAFKLISELCWLKTFQEMEERLGSAGAVEHVAGSHFEDVPSPSSATPPAPPAVQDDEAPSDLEVIDGSLQLHPHGGLTIRDGPSFDRSSTFSNLSMSGLILSKTDDGILTVEHGTDTYLYRYDQGSWQEKG